MISRVEVAARRELLQRNPQPGVEEWLAVTPRETLDMLASFQHTVIRELLRRAVKAAEGMGARSLVISGGVACNSGLRLAAAATLPALSCIFSDAGAFYGQRRDDRGRRFSQIRARGICGFFAAGAGKSGAGLRAVATI